jgi:hypothetical protein
MILCVVLSLVPLSVAFSWLASRRLLRRFETSPGPYFAIAFLLSLLPGALLALLLGALGTLAYNGECYGLSGTATTCTWSEFAMSQFTAAALVGLVLILFSVPLNMTIFYLRWRVVVL